MLLWFIGGAFAIVWNIFRDPFIDYRYVVAGVLLPDVIDLLTGHLISHSVTVAVAALTVVILATWGRRPIRKKLVMIPFGMFLHLVLDAVFTRTRVFWWPFTGSSPVDGRIPSLDRPIWLVVALELVGLALLVFTWPHIDGGRNPDSGDRS